MREEQHLMILCNILTILLDHLLGISFGDSGMACSSNRSSFKKLEKFPGQNNDDLSSWLPGFDRCYVIAGKFDDKLVEGQLLMLC